MTHCARREVNDGFDVDRGPLARKHQQTPRAQGRALDQPRLLIRPETLDLCPTDGRSAGDKMEMSANLEISADIDREGIAMITGAHFLFYSQDPEADRLFFRDVLGFRAVDAGSGWLIFALPPAEMGVHPTNGDFVQRHAEHALCGSVLYLMCDELRSTIKTLEAKNVGCTDIEEAEWGLSTTIKLPSGGEIGLYQPAHPTALALD